MTLLFILAPSSIYLNLSASPTVPGQQVQALLALVLPFLGLLHPECQTSAPRQAQANV